MFMRPCGRDRTQHRPRWTPGGAHGQGSVHGQFVLQAPAYVPKYFLPVIVRYEAFRNNKKKIFFCVLQYFSMISLKDRSAKSEAQVPHFLLDFASSLSPKPLRISKKFEFSERY